MKISNLFVLISLSLLLANCSDDSTIIDPCPIVPEIPLPLMYQVAQLTIDTENATPIVGKDKKDYVNCTLIIDSEEEEWDYTGTGRIRGRGNSTWLWYPKKPYRIKLDKKSEILGLAAEKDWVLLANYRDPTQMMNNFTFIVGEKLGLPYTNHSRYVEVTLNCQYIGLYQLTEQVEQGSNRVAVDDEQGMLISLDADDGPKLNPDGRDNFWSTIYRMPICVKYPEEATSEQLKMVQDDFAQLEQSIHEGNYETTAQLMNIASFIDYILIQELVYNVEVDAPRSIYMHKDKNGLWTMGPLWDFDAGFDFDWETMYTGHNYFTSYKELVLGTDPVNHTGGYHVPNFFTDFFNNKRFVKEYKARWTEVKGKIMKEYWEEISTYAGSCSNAMSRNADRWPIDMSYADEQLRMKQWLQKRIDYLDTVIKGYPAGSK